MPLHPGHSDDVREKNIKEMIDAGHDPKEAVGAAYANQRKYKKMAAGGMVQDDELSEYDKIEDETSDPHTGLFEEQDDSHLSNDLSEDPEHHEMLANKLMMAETEGNGTPDSDIDPEETVSMPESHFAEQAKMAIEARKKKKAIIP